MVGSAAPCVPPSPIPVDRLGNRLPAGLALPPGSRLLEVDDTGGVTTVVGETSIGVSPLQNRLRKELTAAGRVIFSEDNEGIEAELFFSVPHGGIGVVRATRARCPVGMTRLTITLN